VTAIPDRSHSMLATLAFVALALSCAALPGLEPFGPWEGGLVAALAALFVFGMFSTPAGTSRHQPTDGSLGIMTIVYSVFFLLTGLLGLAAGNQSIDVARSVAPYVGLIAALAPWWWSGAPLTARTFNTQLIIVGTGQAVFTFLIFGANTISLDAGALLASRVTQFDARLTMPFTIAAVVIAFVRAAFAPVFSPRQMIYLGLAVLSLAACLATQTRSQVLSVLFGCAIALTFGIFAGENVRLRVSKALKTRLVWIMTVSALGGAFLLLFTEFGSALLNALVLRNAAVGDGRIDYEVIPALELYLGSGPGVWLFGVGAGTPFVDDAFEARTYLHNLTLYALLYGGIVGLVIVLALWWLLSTRVNNTWRQLGDPEWLALLSVIAAMFCYAQFFAVHKILPFNLILWLAATCVFTRLRWAGASGEPASYASGVRRGVAMAQAVRQSRAA